MYIVRILKAAVRDLKRLDKAAGRRIAQRIQWLAANLEEIKLETLKIWVSLILDFLASGATIAELLEEYPQLTREDTLAAISYGAEMSRERYVEISFDDEVQTG